VKITFPLISDNLVGAGSSDSLASPLVVKVLRDWMENNLLLIEKKVTQTISVDIFMLIHMS
jgi:hypothetical protein